MEWMHKICAASAKRYIESVYYNVNQLLAQQNLSEDDDDDYDDFAYSRLYLMHDHHRNTKFVNHSGGSPSILEFLRGESWLYYEIRDESVVSLCTLRQDGDCIRSGNRIQRQQQQKTKIRMNDVLVT